MTGNGEIDAKVFLKRYGGKGQIQTAMNDLRTQYGYYEELDWDQFNLGVTISADDDDDDDDWDAGFRSED